MKIKLLFLIVLSFIISNQLFAQKNKFDSLITAGVYQIYRLEFENAQNTFSTVIKDYPKHPAGKFFDAMIVWWRIMLDLENEQYDEQLEDKLGEVIDFCDEILDKDPKNVEALFFKGGSLGFRGRLYSVRESWLNAALDGKEGLPLVYEAYKNDNSNVDVQLGFGIYNYYAVVIPEKYPFIKPFMALFPKGNKEKGLEQLGNVAWNGKYAKIEARYFLLTSFYQFEQDWAKAKQYAQLLLKDFPNNPAFEKVYARIFAKEGNYPQCAKIFAGILQKCNDKKRGYNDKIKREASYYVGMDDYTNARWEGAKQNLETCERLSYKLDVDLDEESGFLINSVLYLGNIYDMLGKRSEAVKKYKAVLEFRKHGASHDNAKRFLETPYKRM
ncbi:MAG: tetratricopeptide repeat protein [bacterium]